MEVVPEEVDRDAGVLYDVEAHEHLIEDATHDDVEIGSEDEHVEIRSESSVESLVDDQEYDASDDEDSVFSGRGYNLRSNRDRDYSPRINYAMDTPTSTNIYGTQLFQHAVVEMNEGGPTLPVFKHLTGIIMTQMTRKAGVKKHGKAAVTALFEEFFQLDDKTVFKGVDQATLSRKQKRMALRAINLIKEKRCGNIERQNCSRR